MIRKPGYLTAGRPLPPRLRTLRDRRVNTPKRSPMRKPAVLFLVSIAFSLLTADLDVRCSRSRAVSSIRPAPRAACLRARRRLPTARRRRDGSRGRRTLPPGMRARRRTAASRSSSPASDRNHALRRRIDRGQPDARARAAKRSWCRRREARRRVEPAGRERHGVRRRGHRAPAVPSARRPAAHVAGGNDGRAAAATGA